MTTPPTSPDPQLDHDAVLEVVRTFFRAFVSGPDLPDRMAALRGVMLPGAVVVRTCGQEPLLYDVEGFIRPRQELLASGRLVDFEERPGAGRVDLFGDVAQWFGGYDKAWTEDGRPMRGAGMKTIQLVRTHQGWRISAAAWDDEREGLSVPSPAVAAAPPPADAPPAPGAPRR